MLGWRAEDVLGRYAHDVYIPDHLRERYERGVARMTTGDFDLPTAATEFEVLAPGRPRRPVELVATDAAVGRRLARCTRSSAT
jgi:hypothetical protein